jgi:hypothetical protein
MANIMPAETLIATHGIPRELLDQSHYFRHVSSELEQVKRSHLAQRAPFSTGR